MSTASSAAAVLASRRGGDVLIADEPIRIEFAWADLRASDGEEIRLTWAARIACVDSPADRALLAERFLVDGGSTSTLIAHRAATDLGNAMRPAIVRAISELLAEDLVERRSDAEVSAAIETAARSVVFAAGLAILSPFELTVTSPSRDRAMRSAETSARLAAIAVHDEARARGLAEVTRALADAASVADAGRANRMIAGLRLADPLDVLRATAISDPTWSKPEPHLWIAAGTRLARIDATQPTMTSLNESPSIDDSIGPIRSVYPVRIDGAELLLLGARDGVHAVSVDGGVPHVVRSFRHATGTDFGFNAACFIANDRSIVATHSRAGIVVWNWDDVSASPSVVAVERGARSVIAADADRAVLIVDGGLSTFARATGVEPFAGNLRLFSVEVELADGVRARRLIREDPIAGADVRYGRPIGVEDEIEVAGVPRAVRPLAAGGLEMVDSVASSRLSIGPTSLVARSVATRPGFVAAVSVDRTRVSLIDLSQPDVVLAELHVAAAIGSRVADVCFA